MHETGPSDVLQYSTDLNHMYTTTFESCSAATTIRQFIVPASLVPRPALFSVAQRTQRRHGPGNEAGNCSVHLNFPALRHHDHISAMQYALVGIAPLNIP